MPRGAPRNNRMCKPRVLDTPKTPPQPVLTPLPGFTTCGCQATATPHEVLTNLRGTTVADVASPQLGLNNQTSRESPCSGQLGTPYMATPT